MNLLLRVALVVSTGLITVGCGAFMGSGTGNDTVSVTALGFETTLDKCVEHGCPYGCTQFEYGVDDDGDGALVGLEVDGKSFATD